LTNKTFTIRNYFQFFIKVHLKKVFIYIYEQRRKGDAVHFIFFKNPPRNKI
jgi:hypothetical protein